MEARGTEQCGLRQGIDRKNRATRAIGTRIVNHSEKQTNGFERIAWEKWGETRQCSKNHGQKEGEGTNDSGHEAGLKRIQGSMSGG